MISIHIRLSLLMLLFPWDGDADGNEDVLLRQMRTAASGSDISLFDTINQSNAHIYVIMSPIPTRVTHMNHFLDKLGFSDKYLRRSVDIVHAIQISTNNSSMENYRRDGILSKASFRQHQIVTPGRLGCQLSFVKVLKLFLKSSYDIALVFEDDVQISSKFTISNARSLLAQMLMIPISQWDVQYPGFCFACNTPMNFKTSPKASSLLHNTHNEMWLTKGVVQLCRHGITFSRRGASVYLSEWKPMTGPGDVKLSEVICETGKISYYIATCTRGE